ncbi:MAG: hypothetical protein V2B18_21275 [Pseudomonadota bacterium]
MADIALAREQRVFACLETTKGTPVFPSAAVAAQGTITISGGVPSLTDIITIGSQEFEFVAARGGAGQITLGADVAAQGTITLGGLPSLDETFVVDDQTFTFKASRGGAGEVTLGANAPACVTNIAAAIALDLVSVTAADGSGDTVVITAAAAGTAGNALVLTEAATNMTVDGSGTLGGTTLGVDAAPATVLNIVAAITADIPTVATAADGASDTVVVTATQAGAAGNSIVFTESADNLTVNGAGTLGTTTAGSDGTGTEIISAGSASINQQPSFTDSPEIRNSRDVIDRFVDMFPAGEWSVPILSRPNGAGNAPMGDVFFQSLFGSKATNAGVSVVYTQALEKPSFTLWTKRGHTVFFLTGATVGSAKRSLSNKGPALWEMSGQGMKMGWAGKGALNGAEAEAQTVISVADSRLFTANSRIWNVTQDDDNGGVGYTVSAPTRSTLGTTDTITISPAVPAGGWDNADVIQGFLPTGTEIGVPLENRKTVLSIDTVATTIKTLNLTFNDPAKYLDDEIPASGEDYVTDYVEDTRSIEGEIGLNFRKENLAHFYDAIEAVDTALEVITGTVAGYREKITLPYCSKEVPSVEDNAPVVGLTMKVKAMGSVGEDSASLTFY